MMKNVPLALSIAATLAVACSSTRKAPEANATAAVSDAQTTTTAEAVPYVSFALSQQNADAAIYQNSSAEIRRLFQQCYELARLRLDANLAKSHVLPAAVIVDIDETVLDNSPYQITGVAKGRTFTQANWAEWTAKAEAEALPGALDFLRYAKGRGCSIFYISNRSIAEREATIKNLASLGFPDADDRHVLCMDKTSDKTERRAQVKASHYIALLCGDQLRDFDESFKDRTTDYGRPRVDAAQDTLRNYFIMLPNAMYGTWLDAVGGKTDSLKLDLKQNFFSKHAY
ncbi:MAG: 5'-nucleotidase, lipoprotein e(P4) family [Flavobacteriales bacterium]|nr:5'-nucleotidase, lipoprotein e(P4) family [Flavobacteriales bacterium]